MNLPNKLTTMRMALVPVFIVLYLMDYHYTAAVYRGVAYGFSRRSSRPET